MKPLSAVEQRVFFRWRQNPDDGSRNVYLILQVHGPLVAGVVLAAVRQVIVRHESLRTVFREAGGNPVAEVWSADAVPEFEYVLAGRRDPIELASRLARTGFDLAAVPVRAAVIEVAPTNYLVMVTAHPIAADNTSMGILCSELAEAIQGIEHPPGEAYEMPSSAEDGLAFWQSLLAGIDAALDLPTDRARPAFSSAVRETERYTFGRALTRKVRALAAVEDVAVETVLLAAFGIVLRRYTAKEDFIVGTGVDVRAESRFVGNATTTQALRILVPGECSVRDLLRTTGRNAATARGHRDVPLEQATGSGNTPFQVGLRYQGVTLPKLPGVDIEVVDLGLGDPLATGLDLELSFIDAPSGLRVQCEYDAEIFEAARIRRLFGHLATLLAGMATSPDMTVASLSMLTSAEHIRAASEWNSTAQDFPASATLPELFAHQVARAPEKIAVLTGSSAMSYRELECCVEELASCLRAAGTRRGDVVGVAVERTAELPAALLAVQRAGAGYLPLDLSHPDARLRFMLTDSKASVVLACDSAVPRLSQFGVPVLPMGSKSNVYANEPSSTDPADLCYLIYTSGSTGRPKGVLLDQRGRVNNFTDFNRRFAVGPGDALLSVSSLGFDMTAYDVFGPLIAGATLVQPDPSRERDPTHWLELMTGQRVTIWHSVPALLDLLLYAAETMGLTGFPCLRLVLLGGDWIPVGMADRVRLLAPCAHVISLGGATEASMDSTIYPIGEVELGSRRIPYGSPMANQRAYVLDVDGHPAPVGVPGELYLGGAGLAWGYAGAAGQTAKRFLPDPFAGVPGSRLYATGDLTRYREDGVLELLGRMDLQVKIDGNRIELGEVEAVLREQPDVAAAVVGAPIVRGTRMLVGYIVAERGREVDPDELRCCLHSRLPAYMVPSALVPLSRIPLSPNGKVDRKRLPPPPANIRP